MNQWFCRNEELLHPVISLVANDLLGTEHTKLLACRYKVMQENYDYSYAEWQGHFGENMTPFKGYTDTTAVTIPISHPMFKADFDFIGKGAIGLDLPTWFNIQNDKPRIMLIAQDPLRSNKWYGECRDAVISSPFGLHDATHRKHGNGGKMVYELVKRLVAKDCGVYLTDVHKFFIYNHTTSDEYSAQRKEYYAQVMQKEIDIVKPTLCVCFGNQALNIISDMNLSVNILGLPHMSGTARGAIVKRYPVLKSIGASAENVAEQYANEIVIKLNI